MENNNRQKIYSAIDYRSLTYVAGQWKPRNITSQIRG